MWSYGTYFFINNTFENAYCVSQGTSRGKCTPNCAATTEQIVLIAHVYLNNIFKWGNVITFGAKCKCASLQRHLNSQRSMLIAAHSYSKMTCVLRELVITWAQLLKPRLSNKEWYFSLCPPCQFMPSSFYSLKLCVWKHTQHWQSGIINPKQGFSVTFIFISWSFRECLCTSTQYCLWY